MSAVAEALRTAFDLSKDGLMSRCHGWQGATRTCRKPRGYAV